MKLFWKKKSSLTILPGFLPLREARRRTFSEPIQASLIVLFRQSQFRPPKELTVISPPRSEGNSLCTIETVDRQKMKPAGNWVASISNLQDWRIYTPQAGFEARYERSLPQSTKPHPS